MKLEKRGGDGETPVPQEPSSGKKPVVVYIMILFIVAFLLMALSFLMHQRSNSEVLGELQHSVSAMQEVQAVQDKVIELQEKLADAQEEIDTLKDQMAQQEEDAALEEKKIDALLGLTPCSSSTPPEAMTTASPPCSAWRTRVWWSCCPTATTR